MRTYLLILSIVASGCGLTLEDPQAGALDAGPVASLDASADAGDGVDAAFMDAAFTDASRPMDAALPGDDATVPDAGSAEAGLDAGCSIADRDRDGVSYCEGDCDDANPSVYPGAPVICGDGVDNGCLSDVDETACGGIGTYVSPLGLAANPGTQALPVRTIAQGQRNANIIGLGVDLYVAEGHYDEAVTMVETHSILCGYEAVRWTRDPELHVSELRSINNAGVTFPSGITNLTELDGCTVRGRSGQTVSAAMTFLIGASGIARGNHIIAPDNGAGMSVGISVYPAGGSDGARNNPGTPIIEGNLIEMGDSRAGWSPGSSTSLGIWSARTLILINDNVVFLANDRTIQRAIEVRNSPPGSIVASNTIRPSGGRSELTLALRVIGGSVEVMHNDIHPGACDGWCLAAEVAGNLERVSFTNNLLFGGDSETTISAGLLFSFEGAPAGALDVLVHSNLIVGGALGSPAVGVGWWGEGTTHYEVGRVMNNIVYAGRGTQGYAMWERATTLDPERLEGNALQVPSGPTAARPALYYDEGGMGYALVSGVNALPEHMGVPSIMDDCAVIDPRPDGDPHLPTLSPCIDAGTTSEAPPIDWDGEVRPRGRGTDIGVDETP